MNLETYTQMSRGIKIIKPKRNQHTGTSYRHIWRLGSDDKGLIAYIGKVRSDETITFRVPELVADIFIKYVENDDYSINWQDTTVIDIQHFDNIKEIKFQSNVTKIVLKDEEHVSQLFRLTDIAVTQYLNLQESEDDIIIPEKRSPLSYVTEADTETESQTNISEDPQGTTDGENFTELEV